MNASDQGLRAFEGAVAIVTGAGSGIGAALAAEVARRGAAVILADIQEAAAREQAAGIEARGGRATAVALDVTDPAAVKAVVDEAAATHQRLDYLFNNAGILMVGDALQVDLDNFRRVMDINFGGALHGMLAAYPILVRQGFGHIVNMASIAGLVPISGIGYTASKHAVVGLSLSLRGEAALHGVRVSVVCPGRVRTPMLSDGGTYGVDLRPAGAASQDARQWRRNRALSISPEDCAIRTLRGVARNKPLIVFPRRAFSFWRSYRTTPGLMLRLIQYGIARERRDWTAAGPPPASGAGPQGNTSA
jgi:NAD(P)-dependent dehydrogenase (short-subunit alcohol dehydrogenase family)